MYLPAHFEETRAEVMHALMRAHPLASVVIHTDEGLLANHFPMRVSDASAPLGVLRGHVARANPLWKQLGNGVEALAIFQGPQIYITPSHYPTKRLTAKVVPTWNYAVVHAHGTLRAVDDAGWLRSFLEGLTDEHEAQFAKPWHVSDAPEDFIAMQLRAIVGVELTITRLVGKWKMSQNRVPTDRAGVVAGLQAQGSPESLAVAELIARSETTKPDP